MHSIHESLQSSLYKGFIDQKYHSGYEFLPLLLTNDKSKRVRFLSTLLSELESCDEFWLSVAFATTSGVAAIINTLEALSDRGTKGKILVSQYLNFTQPEALRRLSKFKNIDLRIVVDVPFHSKGYLFKKGGVYDLIIGSSNLTAEALCVNKEWNLKISATPKSDIIMNTAVEFVETFSSATKVNELFIKKYELIYSEARQNQLELRNKIGLHQGSDIRPNKMQTSALKNIAKIRADGRGKALLISATGTGKTYLSAFDALEFNPKRLLFIVHRLNIAETALKTFERVFKGRKSMGLFSSVTKDVECDFLFSTIQTLSRPENLASLDPEEFDYILIDETHRAGAESYQRILSYFRPKFLLGMTATPERTDGFDIYKYFDYNIAYEIRLHQALEEEMLSPFHYYGISDITVDGAVLNDNSDFRHLTDLERVKRIVEKSKFYGCDNGTIRGLVFCSRIDECRSLSDKFNELGFKTISLTGSSTEELRQQSILRLESDDEGEKLDYIFTVDIFNEGVDIPRVNQIIMLRPTQSAIIFVQQMGRGLRKYEDKEYLTIIDFIGNYSNNYLVPIALYGDTSYNKDTLRKVLSMGSSTIPGTSTINFDPIAKERIFQSIAQTNLQTKRDLISDYRLLKYKIGRIPMMTDFLEHGSRDPFQYVSYFGSFYNLLEDQEPDYRNQLNLKCAKVLQFISQEINNAIRIEETVILQQLLQHESITFDSIHSYLLSYFGIKLSSITFQSCIDSINGRFLTISVKGRKEPIGDAWKFEIVTNRNGRIAFSDEFSKYCTNEYFNRLLIDSIEYSIKVFLRKKNASSYLNGFILYEKYSRKDVFRVLNWESNPIAQNVGGYLYSQERMCCPIFVTYHKSEEISETTKYDDKFISRSEFLMISKSRRNLNSPEIQGMRNYRGSLRLPLFVKKNDDEGIDFYYLGDVTPKSNGFKEAKMKNSEGKDVDIVQVSFDLSQPVDEHLYNYITDATFSIL